MNKWIKILLGVMSIFAVTIAAIFYLTSGMVNTADSFFSAVKQQNIAKARSYLAEDFKASTDEKTLTEFLSKGAILNFKKASWSNRQISSGRGELNGSITTDSGGIVPIKIIFVKESNAWKIYAIQKPTAGLQSEDSSPTSPGKNEQMALVKQSIHDFIVSVENKNMEHFRGTVSRLWQRQVTTEQLNTAFKSVIDSGANWSVLEGFEPVISPEAKVDENGILLIAGLYQTKPNVHFELKYVYEGLAWKLAGFSIQAK